MSGTGETGATGGTETKGTIVGLKILKASYGTGTTWTDVTKEVQPLLQDDNLNFTVGSSTFGVLDPAPGVKKTFQAKISINGGKPTILTKDDGEIFDITAPTLNKKEKPNHPGIFATSLFYFLISMMALFFSYSGYKFGAYGLQRPWIGYLIGALILATFVSFGAADLSTGIFGILISTPFLSGLLPLLVFLITFITYHFFNDSNFINFQAITGPK
jgi:hypothetical protein